MEVGAHAERLLPCIRRRGASGTPGYWSVCSEGRLVAWSQAEQIFTEPQTRSQLGGSLGTSV